ncbi:MAG: amidase [SAR324 cluster bacterium]|nr:amidase [SAR324 cluster bacterium]
MTEQGLAFLSIGELGRRLRTGELSPLVLAENCLERLERLGPRYNAVVTVTRERALAQAGRAAEELAAGRERGPLHGIPYGAKDLLSTSGDIPTTWGFAPLQDQKFDEDAAVIEKLEAAGAVLAAKLSMVELAGGLGYDQPNAAFTGPGINPWNECAWSGGSSCGPGAAVAAGMVPFAIGTETNGSITSPSAMCGISGLRPGFGRVSRRGAMALSWTLDKIGPMTRSARDCGLVLEAISGDDPEEASTLPDPFRIDTAASPPGGKWRLAVLHDATETDQPEVRENFLAALDLLREVAEIEQVELPPHPYTETALTIMYAEAGAAFAEFWERGWAGQLAAQETRGMALATQTIPAVEYINALRLRQRLHRELGRWLAPYDAVVTPTLKKVAPGLEERFSSYFGAYRRLPITVAGNLLGWPCITVPNGFGERGLPTAIQFVGRPLSENTVLAIAASFQQRTDWHLRRPPDCG